MTQEKKTGFWRASQAVFWSFFGVRKQADYDHDSVKLTPLQIIIAGLIGAALFIATLLGVVYWVMHK